MASFARWLEWSIHPLASINVRDILVNCGCHPDLTQPRSLHSIKILSLELGFLVNAYQATKDKFKVNVTAED